MNEKKQNAARRFITQSRTTCLLLMDRGLGGPHPGTLAVEIERNSEQTPEGDQGHVQHDGGDETTLFHPRGDELAEPITPQVLVDSDCHEERSRHRLIAVDSVCAGDGGDSSDLDAGCGVCDEDNDLEDVSRQLNSQALWPTLILVTAG